MMLLARLQCTGLHHQGHLSYYLIVVLFFFVYTCLSYICYLFICVCFDEKYTNKYQNLRESTASINIKLIATTNKAEQFKTVTFT